MLSGEKSSPLNVFPLQLRCHFCFWFFFLVSFHKFNYNMSCSDFFGFNLLGVHCSLNLSVYNSYQIGEIFHLFQLLLQSYPFPPLPLGLQWHECWDIVIVPWVPEVLLIFFPSFSFICIIFYCSIFKFFPVPSFFCCIHPLIFVFHLLYFSVLKFSFGSTLYHFFAKIFYVSFVSSM